MFNSAGLLGVHSWEQTLGICFLETVFILQGKSHHFHTDPECSPFRSFFSPSFSLPPGLLQASRLIHLDPNPSVCLSI